MWPADVLLIITAEVSRKVIYIIAEYPGVITQTKQEKLLLKKQFI